ncbi:unnamed protein product [Linum trigynum]|uniref:Uncharacterized protein n=1 Tax=Linum trigynum TaxID=586398 RepID=A0AAV2GDC9_9ROSI
MRTDPVQLRQFFSEEIRQLTAIELQRIWMRHQTAPPQTRSNDQEMASAETPSNPLPFMPTSQSTVPPSSYFTGETSAAGSTRAAAKETDEAGAGKSKEA